MPAATSRRVYVGNIAWRVSWQDLKDHFRDVGEPTYAEIFYDYEGRSKGCGVVEFKRLEEAESAISKMTDTKLKGRPIFVREDRESESFSFQQRYRGGYDDWWYGKGGYYKGYDDYGYSRKGGYDYDWDDWFDGKGKGKGKGKGGFGKGHRDDYYDDEYEKGGKSKGKGKGKGGEEAGKGKGKGTRGREKAEADKPSSENLGKQVFVGNLSWETTTEELKEHFSSVGVVVKSAVNSYRNGRSRGTGTVLFKTEAEAQKAIKELNSTQLGGREIFVKEDKYPE
eukprot:GGOE01000668.1.p1 GENE.GGOE01000668.1~~GGOE01000668.1.p1  ORF type:complete len:306 (-),score=16.50 GGOE01000668.1:340-1185(-)